MKVIRSNEKLMPDYRRVIAKKFTIDNPDREKRIVERLLTKSPVEVDKLLKEVFDRFKDRHRDVERIFKDNFNIVSHYVDQETSLKQKLLIGSYFTMEYSVESAALFNPSIVPHPVQSGTEEGELRVIVSFRAVGEGHISSITFRQGIIHEDGSISIGENNCLIEQSNIRTSTLYSKKEFVLSLKEADLEEKAKPILDELISHFSRKELDDAIQKYEVSSKERSRNKIIDTMNLLASTNYSMEFHSQTDISSRVIFPVSKSERKGLEDARFVCFQDASEQRRMYYATYTAFNGSAIIPQLIETRDFIHFTVSSLHGNAAKNKGMAIFPEKIGGRYAMLSRLDNENIYVVFSDNIKMWENPSLIAIPHEDWELIQLGNCGSPIKTDEGWLVLTHGVGPVRSYFLGAMLLDLEDPTKVLGTLKKPLMSPNEEERSGYVPNVLYSCGSVIHNGWLVIPYAMSDSFSSFAKVKVTDLLKELKKN
ncbi:MAG: glycoside hydrolase family 130 protein [Spirochaetales bacterium]|nr:glycoside hydrolase family 130 protein [Spirochaetales bacterium]